MRRSPRRAGRRRPPTASPGGQEQRVGEAVAASPLGPAAASRTVRTAWHHARRHGRGATALARVAPGQPPRRARPPRGRRLRRRRAGAGVRHAGLRRRRGRHPRPRARLHGGLRGADGRLRGPLRLEGVPVHRGPADPARGGPRRSTSRRAASWRSRCGRLRPGADPPARQRQGPGRARAGRSTPASATSSSTTTREIDRLERLVPDGAPRSACSCASRPGSAPTRTRDLDRRPEHEVRLRAADRGRRRSSASTRRRSSTSRACTSTSARRSIDVGSFRAALEAMAGLGDSRHGQPRRRPGRRLRQRRRTRRRSRTTSRRRSTRCTRSSAPTSGSSTSRAARSSPTRR